MGGYSRFKLKAVWRMLDECVPGHRRVETNHHYRIDYNGKRYPTLPKGEHGTKNPEIELGHIRRLARFFEILECASRILGFQISTIADQPKRPKQVRRREKRRAN